MDQKIINYLVIKDRESKHLSQPFLYQGRILYIVYN